MLGPKGRGPSYSDVSTKNMNLHLSSVHRITKENPEIPGGSGLGSASSQANSRILAAFAHQTPKIQFNSDVFKQLLTRWIYVTNSAFQSVEEPTFRVVLSYLLACVCRYLSLF